MRISIDPIKKRSRESNKTKLTLTIDRDLIARAKAQHWNISYILTQALEALLK